jgi:hypothetical protein
VGWYVIADVLWCVTFTLEEAEEMVATSVM